MRLFYYRRDFNDHLFHVIVTKTWINKHWIGIAGCFAVSCAVATLMIVRKLIKSKRLKTFNAMRIFAISMLVSLIWLAVLEMPPVPYVEGSDTTPQQQQQIQVLQNRKVLVEEDRWSSHTCDICLDCF